MRYLKIKKKEDGFCIIDLEKVSSIITGDDFVNICFSGEDYFHFIKERNSNINFGGIVIENFDKLKEFVENLGKEL